MAATEHDMHEGSWLRRAGHRIAVHWVAKMVGTTVAMSAFFVVYFWLLRHARGPVTTVPRIWIDRAIPFQRGALPLYVSLWVYVSLAPSLLVSRRALAAYAAAATVLSVAGFGVFILWPTTVPPPEGDASLASSVAYLKAVDASGNAFPSLHVAFAVFTALWMGRLLRELGAGRAARALNWLWCAGIAYSTVAVRQHVALDALAGAALGAAVAAAHLHLMRGADPARGPIPP
jgi:membrane-associated phospholipid phosphatase